LGESPNGWKDLEYAVIVITKISSQKLTTIWKEVVKEMWKNRPQRRHATEEMKIRIADRLYEEVIKITETAWKTESEKWIREALETLVPRAVYVTMGNRPAIPSTPPTTSTAPLTTSDIPSTQSTPVKPTTKKQKINETSDPRPVTFDLAVDRSDNQRKTPITQSFEPYCGTVAWAELGLTGLNMTFYLDHALQKRYRHNSPFISIALSAMISEDVECQASCDIRPEHLSFQILLETLSDDSEKFDLRQESKKLKYSRPTMLSGRGGITEIEITDEQGFRVAVGDMEWHTRQGGSVEVFRMHLTDAIMYRY
jgi:hypothetical protein